MKAPATPFEAASAVTSEVSYPDPQTVKGRVLGALLRRERLTHKDCWIRFGSSRLSHHIYSLRNDNGWLIETDDLNVKTTDAGRVACIGRYWLTDEVIEEAGERGRQYAEVCARVEARRRAA